MRLPDPQFVHPVQSVSVSGCAGATGDLWDALHSAAIATLSPVRDDADSDVYAMMSPRESQADMDVDTFAMSQSQDEVLAACTDGDWHGGATVAVEHPPEHALTTLSAVRCTSMRSCRIGLTRSGDPAHEGALAAHHACVKAGRLTSGRVTRSWHHDASYGRHRRTS